MVRLICGTLLAACLVGSAARAQRDEDSASTTANRQEALELYRQSRERYDTGAYQEAADLLERAYALFPEPILLYNLARAFGSLGDHERAIESYEAYLDADPQTEDREVIAARIANSRRILEQERERERAQRQAAEAEERARLERVRREARRAAEAKAPRSAPWIIAGSGALVAAAGVVFGGLSLRQRNEAEELSSAVDAAESSDRAVAFGWVANGSFIAGGALALVGTIWGLIDLSSRREDDERRVRVRVRVRVDGVELRW